VSVRRCNNRMGACIAVSGVMHTAPFAATAPTDFESHHPPVRRQVAVVLRLELLHKDVARVVAARDKQLAVVQVEHPPPGQQERGLLVPEDAVADVDQALEGLALLELRLAVLDLEARAAEAPAHLHKDGRRLLVRQAQSLFEGDHPGGLLTPVGVGVGGGGGGGGGGERESNRPLCGFPLLHARPVVPMRSACARSHHSHAPMRLRPPCSAPIASTAHSRQLLVPRGDDVLEVLPEDLLQPLQLILLHADAVLVAHCLHVVGGEGRGLLHAHQHVEEVHHRGAVAQLLGLCWCFEGAVGG